MSEEAAALAHQDALGEPFGDADDAGQADIPEGQHAVGASGAEADTVSFAQEFAGADAASGQMPADPLAAAILAADSQGFLRGVVAALAQTAAAPTKDAGALGIALSELGCALVDGHDEAATLQELVEALYHQRTVRATLQEIAPIIAAFLARVAIGPRLHDLPSTTPRDTEQLLHAAEELAIASLHSGGGRAWRRLPQMAETIARYAERRELGVGALAEALPRLAARFGGGPQAVTSSDREPSSTKLSDREAAGAPRRMLISGPVEIVILDR